MMEVTAYTTIEVWKLSENHPQSKTVLPEVKEGPEILFHAHLDKLKVSKRFIGRVMDWIPTEAGVPLPHLG